MSKAYELEQLVQDHVRAVLSVNLDDVVSMAQMLAETIREGKTILVCGCGGSAADAQHFAAELVGRFVAERRPLPALALTTDTSVITSISNDYGFESVFANQVDAHASHAGALVVLSTSGRSPAVIAAVMRAYVRGIQTVFMTGTDHAATPCSLSMYVDSKSVARIQECHGMILHLVCHLLDEEFADV